MSTSIDPFEQDLRNVLVAEIERQITAAQQGAEEAAASGKEWLTEYYQDKVKELRATTYPWEKQQAA